MIAAGSRRLVPIGFKHISGARKASSHWGISDSWIKTRKVQLQKQLLLIKASMIQKKRLVLELPVIGIGKRVHSFSLSDLAGHGSFIMLALMYLESDIFNLRLYAMSGLTLSMVFQYYREKPLWLPIRWNAVFLAINAMMTLLLLIEAHDVQNIPEEDMQTYERTFKNKGMKPIDFLHLIGCSKKKHFRKGDKLVGEDMKNTRVYLVKSGKLGVYKSGVLVRQIDEGQFVGAMSFLSWSGPVDTAKLNKQIVWDAYDTWNSTSWDVDGFAPLFSSFCDHEDGVSCVDTMYELAKSQQAGALTSVATKAGASSTSAAAVEDGIVVGSEGRRRGSRNPDPTTTTASSSAPPTATVTTSINNSGKSGHSAGGGRGGVIQGADKGSGGRPIAMSVPSADNPPAGSPAQPSGTSKGKSQSPGDGTGEGGGSNSGASAGNKARWSDNTPAILSRPWYQLVDIYQKRRVSRPKKTNEYRLKGEENSAGTTTNTNTLTAAAASGYQEGPDGQDMTLMVSALDDYDDDDESSSPGEDGDGGEGQADVICLEDCVVYTWRFSKLQQTFAHFPSLGTAFERCLSDDITRKLSQTMQDEPLQRYQQILTGVIMDDETTERAKDMLAEYRRRHRIDDHFHSQLLAMAGWTDDEFNAGYKGAPAVQVREQYMGLLRAALSSPRGLTERDRTRLREFRMKHDLRSEAHVDALRRLGWTIDDYEVGTKISPYIALESTGSKKHH